MNPIDASQMHVLPIGRIGENEYRRVVFDVSKWVAEYPNAVIGLFNLVPGASAAYPVANVTRTGSTVTWIVESSDVSVKGNGRCELVAIDNNVVAKSKIWETEVGDALDNSGTTPKPWDSWQTVFIELKAEAEQAAQNAQEAAGHYPNITDGYWYVWDVDDGEYVNTGVKAEGTDGLSPSVSVTDIEGGHRITIVDAEGTHTFDVMNGTDGQDGTDGVSPTISVSDITGGHRLTITDATGTSTVDIMNGTNGQDGDDGYSPTVTVTSITGGHRVTITDATGDHSFDVMDGTGSEVIDDTAGTGVTDKTWSANKLTSEISTLNGAINANTESISDLQKGKAPVILDTASGAIASFPDGADGMPVEHLIVGIEPVQDLHGQDAPYPAGGGKNKWSEGNQTINETKIVAFELPAGTYTFSALITTTISSVNHAILFKENADGTGATYGSAAMGNDTGRNSKTVTLTGTAKSMYFYAANAWNESQGNTTTYTDIQLESGSTATDYAPYSNICPISGWTGCEPVRTGSNLFFKTIANANIDGNGLIGSGSSVEYTLFVAKVKKGVTYTGSLNGVAWGSNVLCAFFTEEPEIGSYSYSRSRIVNGVNPLTAPIDGYVCIRKPNSDVTNQKLEPGSTASSYEAYTGSSYPISWQTEAGTVYGGTLDVTTGVLTVTWVSESIRDTNPSLIGTYSDRKDYGWNYSNKAYGDNNVKAEGFKTQATNGTPPIYCVCGRESNGYITFGVPLAYADSASDARDYIAQYTSKIVYELATPITYQLTPVEVQTLLGTNNIYADTGDVEVQYRADTKRFILKTVADAIS